MCNLYSITRSQDAIRRLFAAARDLTGNLAPQPDVYPDQLAPIVRVADGERLLELMRWGMPGPPTFGGAPVTNIRNTKSPHWRRWLGPDSRCLVPVRQTIGSALRAHASLDVWRSLVARQALSMGQQTPKVS